MKNVHTLLIPDIHGRIFWKAAIEYYSEGTRTLFKNKKKTWVAPLRDRKAE